MWSAVPSTEGSYVDSTSARVALASGSEGTAPAVVVARAPAAAAQETAMSS